MASGMPLRSWSSLDEDERGRLLAAYQKVLDGEPPTCSFAIKFEHMQRWLVDRGVSITGDEIRGKRSGG